MSSQPLSHKGEELFPTPPCCYGVAHFPVDELEYGGGWQDKVVV